MDQQTEQRDPPGPIYCFTRCCDPFANLGWPPRGGRIDAAGRREPATLSYWHHQFNLVDGLDESVSADAVKALPTEVGRRVYAREHIHMHFCTLCFNWTGFKEVKGAKQSIKA